MGAIQKLRRQKLRFFDRQSVSFDDVPCSKATITYREHLWKFWFSEIKIFFILIIFFRKVFVERGPPGLGVKTLLHLLVNTEHADYFDQTLCRMLTITYLNSYFLIVFSFYLRLPMFQIRILFCQNLKTKMMMTMMKMKIHQDLWWMLIPLVIPKLKWIRIK